MRIVRDEESRTPRRILATRVAITIIVAPIVVAATIAGAAGFAWKAGWWKGRELMVRLFQ